LLEDLERGAEAMECYRDAVRADPAMADGHYNLALVCEKLGLAQEAIRHMAQYRRLVAKK
jgi:tetratricopeptide (TPR) repeat protein